MKSLGPVRALFVVAGLYDGIIGAAFLVAGQAIFSHFDITPPNHVGYVQFPALLLIIFALMFFAVAARPRANQNLIPYGILLKLSYSGVIIFHWLHEGLPMMWKPFAIADVIFIALFLGAFVAIEPETGRT